MRAFLRYLSVGIKKSIFKIHLCVVSGHGDFVEIVTSDITHKYSIFIVASDEFFSHKLKSCKLSPVSSDRVGVESWEDTPSISEHIHHNIVTKL